MRAGILLGENAELRVENGALVIGESDAQNIVIIMEGAPGHFKEHPTLGANIIEQINSVDMREYRSALKRNLNADGYSIDDITLDVNG